MLAGAFTAFLWTSCASPQGLGGPNADCFRIEDCQEGLVCIEKKCSRSLGKIAGESPQMAGGGQAGMGAVRDGAVPDAPANGNGDGGPSGGAAGNGGAATGGAPPANGGAPPADAGSG